MSRLRRRFLVTGGGYDVFKFVDMDTQLVEIEDGVAQNEGVTKATRSAIELAVLELIYQGHDRGFWEIKVDIVTPMEPWEKRIHE